MLRQDLALVSSPEEWDTAGPLPTPAASGELAWHARAGGLEQQALAGEGLLQACSAPLAATLAQGCRSCEAGVRAAARGALHGRCALEGLPPEARTRSRLSRDDAGAFGAGPPSSQGLAKALAGVSLLDLHEASRAGARGAGPRLAGPPLWDLHGGSARGADHPGARARGLPGSPEFGDDRDASLAPLELWPAARRPERASARPRAPGAAAGEEAGEAPAPRGGERAPSPGQPAVAAELLHWLERFRLQQHRDAALEWCVRMGASSTAELADHVEDLADALGLKPLERERARRWAQQERADASSLARPSGGPDLKVWDGANSRIAEEGIGELEHEDASSDADDTDLLQASLVSMSRAVRAVAGPPPLPDAPELRRQGAHADLEEVEGLRRQSDPLGLGEEARPVLAAPRSASA
ncbi:unnamed protein product [Prorocentrum cordatum]|uniref:Nuclear pore complex protein n=1 Tax=Prorocentrum cordatum TaxID=2364126 RepID=A0ABN9U0P0_9DINO|nr:unnamed protein product [Polarella glacialis]